MKSTTLLLFLISSVIMASADYVPKWNTSCLMASDVSTNIWQPTSITVSPTPPPSSLIMRLTVCGLANEDFVADKWNTTTLGFASNPALCGKGIPHWTSTHVFTSQSATAGSEYCSEVFIPKASETSGTYISFLTTMVLNDDQNRNLGCFTLFDTLDENFDKECEGKIDI